jgi:hypothetical protein
MRSPIPLRGASLSHRFACAIDLAFEGRAQSGIPATVLWVEAHAQMKEANVSDDREKTISSEGSHDERRVLSRRPDLARRRGEQLIVGRLQAHGHAHYQFRNDQDVSYYLKVLTDRGERVLWGKDLERAMSASQTQPKMGDMIGARRTARETVTVVERHRDAAGRIVSQEERLAHRNQWRVEKLQFFAERAKLARRLRDAHGEVREAVRAQPELKSTFLTLRAAEELAARRIADPEDQRRFLKLVKEAIASSIEKGEPLLEVRLNEHRASRAPARARQAGKTEEGPAR